MNHHIMIGRYKRLKVYDLYLNLFAIAYVDETRKYWERTTAPAVDPDIIDRLVEEADTIAELGVRGFLRLLGRDDVKDLGHD